MLNLVGIAGINLLGHVILKCPKESISRQESTFPQDSLSHTLLSMVLIVTGLIERHTLQLARWPTSSRAASQVRPSRTHCSFLLYKA